MLPARTARTRRPGDVFANGEILHGPNDSAENHRNQRRRKSRERDTSCQLSVFLVGRECEKDRERTSRQQQILKQLRVRAEHRKSDRNRQNAPRPRAAVANTANQHPQAQRHERAHVQLSVVTGRRVARDRTAHHVGQPAG